MLNNSLRDKLINKFFELDILKDNKEKFKNDIYRFMDYIEGIYTDYIPCKNTNCNIKQYSYLDYPDHLLECSTKIQKVEIMHPLYKYLVKTVFKEQNNLDVALMLDKNKVIYESKYTAQYIIKDNNDKIQTVNNFSYKNIKVNELFDKQVDDKEKNWFFVKYLNFLPVKMQIKKIFLYNNEYYFKEVNDFYENGLYYDNNDSIIIYDKFQPYNCEFLPENIEILDGIIPQVV